MLTRTVAYACQSFSSRAMIWFAKIKQVSSALKYRCCLAQPGKGIIPAHGTNCLVVSSPAVLVQPVGFFFLFTVVKLKKTNSGPGKCFAT